MRASPPPHPSFLFYHPTSCSPLSQVHLHQWGANTVRPGRICHFSYAESSALAYAKRHGTSTLPPDLLARLLPPVDAVAPTLAASHSSHPFLLGACPTYLGSRALLSKQGIPPSDPLHRLLEDAPSRLTLRAVGLGVHFLAASAVLHLISTEAHSPLRGQRDWSWASAYTGGDTFGAAFRAHVSTRPPLAASEVPFPPSNPL